MLFISYYIQLALTLKLIYLIAIKIDFIDDYIKDNFETSSWVRCMRIIFGQHSNIEVAELDEFEKIIET